MSKKISQGKIAKEKLLSGAQTLTDAVSSTLGPKGQSVLIDRGFEAVVINDGVTVAQNIELEDPEENNAVRILRQAANKQVDEVGDGTTVVTILGNEIFKELHKQISAGFSATMLRKELEETANIVLAELTNMAKPVKTKDQKIQVATISAGDSDLGKLIGETIHNVGVDGVITVEESKANETFLEYQQGMQFDRGYASPYFVTNPARMEATVEDPAIFITDNDITNIFELQELLQSVEKIGIRNFVFFAKKFGDQVLGTFALNKQMGKINVLAVEIGGESQAQKEFLQDLCILTGAALVSKDTGILLTKATVEVCGKAERITSTKDATLIVGGKGDKKLIKERVDALKVQFDRAEGSDFEIAKLKERIAKLTAGVAVIKVGGVTEVEMKERKERAIDAVAATQAAVEQGIVAGGEVAYLKVRRVLGDMGGEGIMKTALKKPFEILLRNADMDAGKAMAELEFKYSDTKDYGVDVTDNSIKNMFTAGIIDPVKVTKRAVANAVSVAIQLATTGFTITNIPEKKENK